ncbi:MAG: hypothetical protein CTY34_05085 [Methylobacter sp.]|nr:MAG: hypothetical protein CTY34_05085 [Methylobacter sp.]
MLALLKRLQTRPIFSQPKQCGAPKKRRNKVITITPNECRRLDSGGGFVVSRIKYSVLVKLTYFLRKIGF